MSSSSAIRGFVFLILFSSLLLAQNSNAAGAMPRAEVGQPAPAQNPAHPSPPQAGDDLAQIRDDLNKMESLNLNMSSEIEFLHDQNLQILLRTNSQMWTILIRDLRRQLALQGQQKAVVPPALRK
jgi:hypothetical protein